MPWPNPSGLTPRINGAPGAYLQPIRFGRDQTGNYELYTFRGTKTEIETETTFYANIIGITYEVTQLPGNLWQLDVRFPYNADNLVDPRTDFVDAWEFFRQDHEKDLLESIDPQGLVSTLTQPQKTFIRNKLQNPPQGTTADPAVALSDFQNLDDANGTPVNQQNAFTIYQLMLRGVRSMVVHVPMLRHTTVTSLQYAGYSALVGAGRIYSTASLLASNSIPGFISWALPNDTSPDTDLVFGWLKGYPTINEIALNKWQIVQEWTYGWWAKLLYGTVL